MVPRRAARFAPLGLMFVLALGVADALARDPGAPGPVAAPRTEADRGLDLASFDHVWRTVRDRYFDPTLGGVDWDAARAELRPKVEGSRSRAEARAAMQALLSRLGRSHLEIIPKDVYSELDPGEKDAPGERSGARSEPAGDAAAGGSGVSGLTLRVVGGEVLVVRVESGSPAERAGVRAGYRVLKIGRRDVADVLARTTPGGDRSLLIEALRVRGLEARLDRDPGGSVEATFLDARGRKVAVRVESAAPRGTYTQVLNLPAVHVRTETRRLEGGVGYFFVSLFADPAGVMGALERAMAEFEAAPGLILDLRGNPGGIGAMAIGFGGFFVDRAGLKLGTMVTRETRLDFVLNPRPRPFAGRLAVLVDECSISTSEILAGGLKDIGRARVFGVRTPGAALPSVIEVLPNGDRFQFAFADYVSAAGRPLEGHGVVPDVVVPPDRSSLLRGEDPPLREAVRWILGGS